MDDESEWVGYFTPSPSSLLSTRRRFGADCLWARAGRVRLRGRVPSTGWNRRRVLLLIQDVFLRETQALRLRVVTFLRPEDSEEASGYSIRV